MIPVLVRVLRRTRTGVNARMGVRPFLIRIAESFDVYAVQRAAFTERSSALTATKLFQVRMRFAFICVYPRQNFSLVALLRPRQMACEVPQGLLTVG